MKKIYCIFLLVGLISNCFAQLQPGDILFTGYNADTTKSFSFICLVDIPANTQINFTDKGWLAGGGFRTGEGVLTWTSPASLLPIGTEVIVTDTNAATVSVGSLVETDLGFTLAASGDQIFAYDPNNIPDATDETGFYAGIQMNSNWETDATSSNTTSQPNALIGFSLAITPERDNAVYNCSVTTGAISTLKTALVDQTNWDRDNASTIALGQCAFTGLLSNSGFNTFNVKISPNPTHTGKVTILSGNTSRMMVTVFDVLGKQVKKEIVLHNTINVTNLKTGVYILRITQQHKTLTKKLIIK